MSSESNANRSDVAQASSPASFGTVPVPGSAASNMPPKGSGGETPPEIAGETPALHDATNPLVGGFHSRGTLPHLKKEGGTYFVTFRQAGTLPKDIVLRLKQEREAILQHAMTAKRPLTWHEEQELFRWYSSRVDRYLDAGHGICHLRESKLADLVAGAIRFFQGERYELHAWAVMPNHVHAVVWPMPGYTLSDIYTVGNLSPRMRSTNFCHGKWFLSGKPNPMST